MHEIESYQGGGQLQVMQGLSAEAVVGQVRLIQEIMRDVMKSGEHYGMIPGTTKNTLFKPGAEKICFTFQLVPEFKIDERNMGGDHREFVVFCVLKAQNGRIVGQGVGSCSTKESKYRYRGTELVPTGKPVPKGYWDSKDAKLLGGPGFVAKKDEAGQWMIFAKGTERSENPDIADLYNTVLKMAKKRAHVDATITATATSDIFTQDLEDLHDYSVDAVPAAPPAAPAPNRAPPRPNTPSATQRPAATQPRPTPAPVEPTPIPVEKPSKANYEDPLPPELAINPEPESATEEFKPAIHQKEFVSLGVKLHASNPAKMAELKPRWINGTNEEKLAILVELRGIVK